MVIAKSLLRTESMNSRVDQDWDSNVKPIQLSLDEAIDVFRFDHIQFRCAGGYPAVGHSTQQESAGSDQWNITRMATSNATDSMVWKHAVEDGYDEFVLGGTGRSKAGMQGSP
jgi:hypothetical protein